jgi:hypothetical protein
MSRDLGLADKMRDAGLDVVEVAGWQTRGSSSFSPRGFVWHHTAGPRTGIAPSLGVCINGRRDLPGPLCNLFLDRAGTVYVVASGRANHAGAGSWAGLTGNASVYGLEIENVGTPAEPWSPLILDIAARIAAATGVDHELACLHREWAPRRKVDLHTVTGRDMRARVAQLRNPRPPVEVEAPSPSRAQEADNMQTIVIVETVGIFHVVGSLAPSRVEVDELVMLRAAAEEQGWTLAEIHKTPTQWKAMQAR